VTQSEELQIELPVNIDAGEPFVKATYSLKGDGHLTLRCYEILDDVSHLPNRALIVKKKLSLHTELDGLCHFLCKPGLDYCESMFDGDLPKLPAVNAFKSSQLFNPRKLRLESRC